MNVLALCAGAGGLELGVKIAEPASRCVAYVEREAYAAGLLVARMEDQTLDAAPVWSDLGTFDGRPWRGVVDCIVSGDPCQPNSVAGKGLGEADDRWLADHVLRIVDECRPARVFRENVTGNADGQLGVFVPALERLGYSVKAGIFSAEEVGASHRRERLFIMADRGCRAEGWLQYQPGAGGSSSDLDAIGQAMADATRDLRGTPRDDRSEPFDGAGDRGAVGHAVGSGHDRDTGKTGRRTVGRTAFEGAGEGMGHAAGIGRGEGRAKPELRGRRDAAAEHGGELAIGDGIGLEGQRAGDGTQRRENERRSAGLCSGTPIFAPGPNDPRWPEILRDSPHLEPAICRVADGMAHRIDRLRACGNGVFPLAAAFAWCALGDVLAGTEANEPVLTAGTANIY